MGPPATRVPEARSGPALGQSLNAPCVRPAFEPSCPHRTHWARPSPAPQCYDHYCPWVGATIGKGNRHYFLIFLWLELGAVLVSGLVAISRIHSGGCGGVLQGRAGWWAWAGAARCGVVGVSIGGGRGPGEGQRPWRRADAMLADLRYGCSGGQGSELDGVHGLL